MQCRQSCILPFSKSFPSQCMLSADHFLLCKSHFRVLAFSCFQVLHVFKLAIALAVLYPKLWWETDCWWWFSKLRLVFYGYWCFTVNEFMQSQTGAMFTYNHLLLCSFCIRARKVACCYLGLMPFTFFFQDISFLTKSVSDFFVTCF